MFFRMLKNDLKAKKGLNVILFIFMIAAAALVFVGAVQLYSSATGDEYTQRICNTSDAYIYTATNDSEMARRILDEIGNVNGYVESEAITIRIGQIDFDNYDEKEDDNFFNKRHYLVRQSRASDLTYDVNDRPFYVENGTVYISVYVRDRSGAKIGDKLRITTDMGETYEFTIAGFYKEIIHSRNRYIISDSDYERLSSGYPLKLNVFETDLDVVNTQEINSIAASLNEANISYRVTWRSGMTEDETMMFILAAFIVAVSIFMILIIFMTIRFTMISAIRDEEKEIGTMRAIGADTLSFRWLFCAKYIGFAIVGGLIGIVLGLFLSDRFMKTFSANILFPTIGAKLVIGAASVAVMIALIVLFCLFVMRRIDKISVIDAIHGEAGGERFGKSSILFLHKRKTMKLPLYLALSDILKNFKRYLFLVAGYMLGAMIILLVFYISGSVISKDFVRYWGINRVDFSLDFNQEMMREYRSREVLEGKDFWELINEDLEANDIPAHAELNRSTDAYLIVGDEQIVYDFVFDADEPENYLYTDDSRVPVLANEIALSMHTADTYGIKIGDIVTFEIPESSDGGLTVTNVRRDFVVTGILKYAEFYDRMALTGSEYHGATLGNVYWSSLIIDEGGEETFARIEQLYGADHVKIGWEYIRESLSDYEELFSALKTVLTVTVILINLLMTVLYLNIFRYEERGETALLNTVGISSRTVALWQVIRMVILTLIAAVIGTIIVNTLGQYLARILFDYLTISGFKMITPCTTTFFIMPLIVFSSVLIPTILKLRDLKTIRLSDIAEE